MTVFVVDDDASLREALGSLLRSAGFAPALFGSAQDFLAVQVPDAPCCLILDVQLPGLSGLDLQAELAAAHIQIPIVFISGHADVPSSVQAMKAGAVEFLTKPLQENALMQAVTAALERDRGRLEEARTISSERTRYATLTEREKEVMTLVAAGLMNKQIAAEMGIAEKTVKIHRGHLTRKLAVRSIADLVRLADRLGIPTPKR